MEPLYKSTTFTFYIRQCTVVTRRRVPLPAAATSGSDPGKVVHTHVNVSVTDQYISVQADERWCSEDGKELATHWPRIIDISGAQVGTVHRL